MSKYKLSRVVQVTPGNIPIPTKGWGAVEKIIWEYKKTLENVGYEVEILYTDDVKNEPDQIVHVHMANLAKILHDRGIDYVFSLHDHHVEFFGKESQCYKDNYEAIKNSKLTLVHSPHLVEYFDRMPNIVYLQHGANLDDYKFVDRSESVRMENKLVMMANNGLAGDPLIDRKGFLKGISAAMSLGLGITIICPGTNRQFFEHHLAGTDAESYGGLRILYDLDYEEAIYELGTHNIFLNPSSLEAGHPNLTVTESIAMGIPVVGTSKVEIPGLVICEEDVESISRSIVDCITRYDSLIEQIRTHRNSISWDIVVTKMLQHYKRAFAVSEKSQLEWQYSKTKIQRRPKQEKSGFMVDFRKGRAFLKTSFFSEGLHARFVDRKTNRLLFDCAVGKTPGVWSYIWAPNDQFIDWEVTINFGVTELHKETLDLTGKKVLITGNPDEEMVNEFCITTGAFVTLRDKNLTTVCYDPNADDELFYTTLNEHQLRDFFVQKPRKTNSYLLKTNSTALGDTIGFLPYAQRWAENNGLHVDVSINRPEMFQQAEYPNLNLILRDEVDESSYNKNYFFEYLFDRPLQRGYSDQFGLEYEEILPKLKSSNQKSPLKQKYVVIGVQTTAQCKYWNYPNGWEELCRLIDRAGYRPVAVDLHEVFGIDGHWNSLPKNALKKVGMSFDDVMRWIEHCEVFVGVSSGLAWLAYGLGKKVVMITGTTMEDNEFSTNNTVVANRSVCNGCFNRPHLNTFNAGDWLWCPEHRGTQRHFECTKTITPGTVFDAIKENL
jgi:autotransporter strand-loop-strand O-heptosyltransferase